jgi:hypothetical protein
MPDIICGSVGSSSSDSDGSVPTAVRPLTALTRRRILEHVFLLKVDGEPCCVLPGVYLGSVGASLNTARLQELGVTSVLSAITSPLNIKGSPSFIRASLTLPIIDLPSYDISLHFEESFQFIEENCGEGRGALLVHCFGGKSRSVTLVCAYLMRKLSWTAVRALKHIRALRPVANPNVGFLLALIRYQTRLTESGMRLQKAAPMDDEGGGTEGDTPIPSRGAKLAASSITV